VFGRHPVRITAATPLSNFAVFLSPNTQTPRYNRHYTAIASLPILSNLSLTDRKINHINITLHHEGNRSSGFGAQNFSQHLEKAMTYKVKVIHVTGHEMPEG